jgi:fucose permease
MNKVDVKEEFGGFKAYTVCLVSALFFFFVFIQMNCWNVLSHHFSSLFNLSNSQAVGVFQMYFFGNVLCLFPAGLLLDRVSTRWVLVTAMLVAVLAVVGFSFATELWQVKLSRFLIGCC